MCSSGSAVVLALELFHRGHLFHSLLLESRTLTFTEAVRSVELYILFLVLLDLLDELLISSCSSFGCSASAG